MGTHLRAAGGRNVPCQHLETCSRSKAAKTASGAPSQPPWGRRKCSCERWSPRGKLGGSSPWLPTTYASTAVRGGDGAGVTAWTNPTSHAWLCGPARGCCTLRFHSSMSYGNQAVCRALTVISAYLSMFLFCLFLWFFFFSFVV